MNIGKDNVQQLYPTKQGGSEVYLDLSSDNPNNHTFNISYGHGSHLPATKHNENGITYFNTTGSKISYKSGSPDGRSVRLDMIPSGGPWADESNTSSWDDKPTPDFLYDEKGFRNHEITYYIRPHGDLGTHQSCAFKLQGKDDDNGRSVIEMLYPENTHKKVEVNVNYEHFPYVNYKDVTQHFDSKLQVDKWTGLKVVYIVPEDKKSVKLEMYVSEDPFNADGSPKNDWKVLAECNFKGVPEYKNVIPSWRGRKDYLRVDGFESVDFTLTSDREIDYAGAFPSPDPVPPNPNPTTTPTPIPPIDIDKLVTEITNAMQTMVSELSNDIKQILDIVSKTNPPPVVTPPTPLNPPTSPTPSVVVDDSGDSQNT